MLKGIAGFFTGLLVGMALFLAFSAVMRTQTVTLPAVTGTSPVGRAEVQLVDAGRVDPFATDGRDRELAVWMWYPAVEGATGAAAPYLPAAWAPLVNNMGPLSQDLMAVRTNALANAPMAGRPPVVVLLPGLGQPVASYTVLAEDLASHGYVVIGINPTESTDVVFPDGRLVPATALGSVMEPNIDDWYASAARVTNVWVADAEFVVKTLSANAPAIGPLDFNRVAYVGHSVGGAAALEACRMDSRCSGAVDLDGTLWTDVRTTGLQAPSLIIQSGATAECDDFCQRANADFANVIAAGNSQQLRVAGSQHANFQDGGLMWGPLNGLALGSIDPVRMADITRDTVRAFLDVQILDEPAGTLSTVIGRYPELR